MASKNQTLTINIIRKSTVELTFDRFWDIMCPDVTDEEVVLKRWDALIATHDEYYDAEWESFEEPDNDDIETALEEAEEEVKNN